MAKAVSFVLGTALLAVGVVAAISIAQHIPAGTADTNVFVLGAVALALIGVGTTAAAAYNR